MVLANAWLGDDAPGDMGGEWAAQLLAYASESKLGNLR